MEQMGTLDSPVCSRFDTPLSGRKSTRPSQVVSGHGYTSRITSQHPGVRSVDALRSCPQLLPAPPPPSTDQTTISQGRASAPRPSCPMHSTATPVTFFFPTALNECFALWAGVEPRATCP